MTGKKLNKQTAGRERSKKEEVYVWNEVDKDINEVTINYETRRKKEELKDSEKIRNYTQCNVSFINVFSRRVI